jgi:hypothetical protein
MFCLRTNETASFVPCRPPPLKGLCRLVGAFQRSRTAPSSSARRKNAEALTPMPFASLTIIT